MPINNLEGLRKFSTFENEQSILFSIVVDAQLSKKFGFFHFSYLTWLQRA
jgi:hypothetical protein